MERRIKRGKAKSGKETTATYWLSFKSSHLVNFYNGVNTGVLILIFLLRKLRRSQMRPRRRLLACRGGLQDQRIGVPAADDLQRHRQPLGGESTRHAGGWLSRQVERKGERKPVEHRWRWGTVDGAWAALDRPRRQRHLRGEQQVVSIEQAPPPGGRTRCAPAAPSPTARRKPAARPRSFPPGWARTTRAAGRSARRYAPRRKRSRSWLRPRAGRPNQG